MNIRIHTVANKMLTPLLLVGIVAGLTGCPELQWTNAGVTYTARPWSMFSFAGPSASCSFTATPLRGLGPLAVQFNAEATALLPHYFDTGKWRSSDPNAIHVVSWDWWFSDNTFATGQNPTHTFTAPGKYNVVLTVTLSDDTSARMARLDYIEVLAPPVANAGDDARYASGSTIQLDGTRSYSPVGKTLQYTWSFSSVPVGSSISTVSLSNPHSPRPTFAPDRPGEYILTLTVSDGDSSSTDSVRVVVAGSPPVAMAGPDQVRRVHDTVTLDGHASYDPDGDSISYLWMFYSRPAGSSATLDNTGAVYPHFTIDRPGQYTLMLTVIDQYSSSSPDMVTITTENSPPVANAGPDQAKHVGQTVTLDGTGSSDADGDTLTYQWTFVSTPGGAQPAKAVISNPTSPTPSFVADQAGQYVVQLVVNDGQASSTPDTVVITAGNTAPVANAGPDQSHPVGTLVQLDGSGSQDPDGDALTYSWSVVSSPVLQRKITTPGGVTLSDPHSATPTFTMSVPGQYVFQLIVNDGFVNSAPDTVTIDTSNTPPVANAGPDQALPNGSPVTLTGAGSSDADGNPLTYQWTLITRPAGSAAALSGPTTVGPTFTMDKKGTYVAQLIVNDGIVDSAPDTVTLTAQNRVPVANAGYDNSGTAGQALSISGAASSDADGDPLTYTWTIAAAPTGSTAVLGNATTATPSFTPDRAGNFTFQLIVNDGTADSAPDTVSFSIIYPRPTADAGDDQTFHAAPNGTPAYAVDNGALLSLRTRMSEYKGGGGSKGGWDAYTGALLDVIDPSDCSVKDTIPIVTQWAHIYPTNAAGLATNPVTGEAWALLHMAPYDMVGGYGPGKGLSASPEALVRVDIQTGMATTIGYLSTECVGLAITEDGSLYTLAETLNKGKGGPTLYGVDRATAELTDLGTVATHDYDGIAGSASTLYRVFGGASPSGSVLDPSTDPPTETPIGLPEDSDGWYHPLALARNPMTGMLYLATENEADNGSTLYAFTPALPQPKGGTKAVDGWYMNPDNGHRYKLLPASSWQDARDAAIGEGAHLVVVNDEAEYQWLQRVFPQIFWLGYQDLDLDRTWDWVASSSYPVYWYGGSAPALSVPTAAALDPGYWGFVGRDASSQYQGLAEKESETVTHSPSRLGALEYRSDGLGFAWTVRAASVHIQADGSGSSDPLGNPLAYAWSLMNKPAGSNATLAGADTATPSFDADVRGDYTLELTVTTVGGSSASDSVTFTYANTKPVANAGSEQVSLLLQDFAEPYQDQRGLEFAHMDGTGSSDADHDSLTYTWTVISKPTDSTVGDEWEVKASYQGITDDSSPVLRVLPDLLGDYVFQLVVNDGYEDSDPVQVTLHVQPNIETVWTGTSPYDYSYYFAMGPRADEVTTYSIPSDAPELPAFYTGGDLFDIGLFEITNAQYMVALNYAYSLGMLDPFPTDGSSHDAYLGGRLLLKTSGGAAAGEYCDIEFDNGRFVVAQRDGLGMLQFPVVNVTWHGAVAFCNWISTSSGLDERYDLAAWTENPLPPPWNADYVGYRLPYEPEWEYAAAWQPAMMGKTVPHWIFGYESNTISDANCNYNSANPLGLATPPYTTPVGYYDGTNQDTELSTSYLGVYDASGNVWEWVWDAAQPYEATPTKNGGPAFDGNSNVVRGGGWRDAEYYQRTAYRRALFPQTSSDEVGFRIARDVIAEYQYAPER